MGMYVSTTLVGIIAFIMVFTYTAESVFFSYGEDLDKLSFMSSGIKENTTTFENFININYYVVKTSTAEVHNKYKAYLEDTIDTMLLALRAADKDKFNKYNKGIDLYNNYEKDWKIQSNFFKKSDWVKTYNKWISDGGLHQQTENVSTFNIFKIGLDQLGLGWILDWTASIQDWFGNLFDLLTFNVVDHYGNQAFPDSVKTVLYLFFGPMWIILGVEMIPLISKLLEGLGAIIPF